MMWEMVKLGEIIEFSNGINFDKSSYASGIKFISVSDFGNRFFPQYNDLSEVKKDIVRANDLLQEGDIVFVRSNGNKELVGRCMLIKDLPEPVTYSGFVIRGRIADHNKYDPVFFTYYFKSKAFRRAISGTAVGANIQNLSQGRLTTYTARIPDFYSQRLIADILSAYDDLIENNQKQIKLLEEAAQRLYKEWFIDLRFPGHENTPIHDGLPEGWERLSMAEIAEYLNGYAFKPEDWHTEGMPIIKIKELNEGVTSNTPRNNGDGIPSKYIISSGDILFSWSATLTAKIWDSENGLLNQHLFKVTPIEGIPREFVFQSIIHTLEEFRNLTTGSTMKHIQRGKLDDVVINIPNNDIFDRYVNISEKTRNLIIELNKKVELLIESRDLLLPNLMNGNMEV